VSFYESDTRLLVAADAAAPLSARSLEAGRSHSYAVRVERAPRGEGVAGVDDGPLPNALFVKVRACVALGPAAGADGARACARGWHAQATLVWTDPPGALTAASNLVNDLDLCVRPARNASCVWGNHRARNRSAGPDRTNNVEQVELTDLTVRGSRLPAGRRALARLTHAPRTQEGQLVFIDVTAAAINVGSVQAYALVVGGHVRDVGIELGNASVTGFITPAPAPCAEITCDPPCSARSVCAPAGRSGTACLCRFGFSGGDCAVAPGPYFARLRLLGVAGDDRAPPAALLAAVGSLLGADVDLLGTEPAGNASVRVTLRLSTAADGRSSLQLIRQLYALVTNASSPLHAAALGAQLDAASFEAAPLPASPPSDHTLLYIICAAAGGAALLLVAAWCCWRRRVRQRSRAAVRSATEAVGMAELGPSASHAYLDPPVLDHAEATSSAPRTPPGGLHGWLRHEDAASGQPYFYNPDTLETRWDLPPGAVVLAPLAAAVAARPLVPIAATSVTVRMHVPRRWLCLHVACAWS
jgi:hypothetical protein